MLTYDRLYEVPLPNFQFCDQRLNLRASNCLKQILRSDACESFPKIFAKSKELKGFYRLMNNKYVDPQKINQSAASTLSEWVGRPDTPTLFYQYQDSTYGSYRGRNKLDLGYLENKTDNGVVVHSALLTDAQYHPLGIPYQKIIRRPRDEYGKSKQRKQRPFEEKESYKWVAALDWIRQVQSKNNVEVISIADREGDIQQYFDYCYRHHIRFIIRARHDRKLPDEELKLWDYLRQQTPQYNNYLRVVLDPNGKRVEVSCDLYYGQVKVKGIEEAIGVLYLKQHQPTNGRQLAGEWAFFTNLDLQNIKHSEQILDHYTHRWRTCEDFHKCLKTGCSIEQRQFDNPEAMCNAIALLSLVAIRLLRLRHAATDTPDRSLDEYLKDDEKQLATLMSEEYLLPRDKKYCQPNTVLWFILTIARMGGHQGMSTHGMPGWQTIWKGWKQFEALLNGIRLAREMKIE